MTTREKQKILKFVKMEVHRVFWLKGFSPSDYKGGRPKGLFWTLNSAGTMFGSKVFGIILKINYICTCN